MKFKLYLRIALKQVLSSSNSGFVRTVSSLSMIGIAIGVAALLILNSFMDGFSDSIYSQLSAIHPPVEIRIPGGYCFTEGSLADGDSLASGLSFVTQVSPVLEKTVVVAGNSGDVAGVRLRGVDWSVEPAIVSGRALEDLNVPGRGAVIGTGLSLRLDVVRGDSIRLASPDATGFTSMGTLVVDTIVSVPVAAVRDFGIEEYNSSLIMTDLQTSRSMFREDVRATSLSAGLAPDTDPVDAATVLSRELRDFYVSGGGEYMIADAFITTHRNLFAALGLEKTGMTIVLALIGVVALLNLLSALSMISLEHVRDTGVLRTMGATRGSIVFTGLLQGGLIGFAGALVGSGFAILAVLGINRFFPIRLDGSVYWIDSLPGKVQPLLVLLISVSTVAACLLASLFPALRAVGLSPSRAVRYE